jgi:hypothetical protein
MSAVENTSDRGEPRIPWRRIALVHFGAALVVMVVVLAVSDPGLSGLQFVPFGILPVLLGGALPTFLGARIAWHLVTRRGRELWREIGAVAVGALVGALLPWIALIIGTFSPELIAALIGPTAVFSALGFAIWIRVAWRARPPRTETPGDSLN